MAKNLTMCPMNTSPLRCFGGLGVGQRLVFEPVRPQYLELPHAPFGHVVAPLRNGRATDAEDGGKLLDGACKGDGLLCLHALNFSRLKAQCASTLKRLDGSISAMPTLADRIIEAMGEMPQAEFSRRVGVSESAVNQWRLGKTKSLKAATATSIQSVTGYSAQWLVTGKGPKRIGPAPPSPPPRDYADNLMVTPEQWQLLIDIEMMLTPQQIADIQERAKHARAITMAEIERQKAVANGKDKAK